MSNHTMSYESLLFNYIFELWTVCKIQRRAKICPSCRQSRAKKPSASDSLNRG